MNVILKGLFVSCQPPTVCNLNFVLFLFNVHILSSASRMSYFVFYEISYEKKQLNTNSKLFVSTPELRPGTYNQYTTVTYLIITVLRNLTAPTHFKTLQSNCLQLKFHFFLYL